VELAEANRPGGDELSLRQAEGGRADPRPPGRERAEEPSGADRCLGDSLVEEPVEDDLLVAHALAGGARVDAGVPKLPVRDPDELRAGGGARFQAAVNRDAAKEDGDGEQA